MPSTKTTTRRIASPDIPNLLDLVPVLLALIAMGAILIGARSELVVLRPTYDGPIQAVQTWATQINHTEQLLAQLAALGVVGAVVSIWRRRVALVIQGVAGVVLFYAVRTALYQYEAYDLYTAIPLLDGTTGAVVLGPAIGWFALAGILLLIAGVASYHPRDPTVSDGQN